MKIDLSTGIIILCVLFINFGDNKLDLYDRIMMYLTNECETGNDNK